MKTVYKFKDRPKQPNLKAFYVPCDEYGEGSLLVYALTPSKARYLALHAGLWDYGEYKDVRVKRISKFDDLAEKSLDPTVVETNAQLPKGRGFYSEDPDFLKS